MVSIFAQWGKMKAQITSLPFEGDEGTSKEPRRRLNEAVIKANEWFSISNVSGQQQQQERWFLRFVLQAKDIHLVNF
jgi:hypothetical protein